jgi:uncharacterized membrane protein
MPVVLLDQRQVHRNCLIAGPGAGLAGPAPPLGGEIAMIQLPPVPPWDSLHPLVVHFPIALLLVAPLFVVAGIVRRTPAGRAMLLAALGLMILGTIGTFVAVGTGEAAARLADRSPEINAVLERHEELAETTRVIFGSLTVVFALVLLARRSVERAGRRALAVLLPSVFLVFYAAGAFVLASTAHNGGRLVHQLGVHAVMAEPALASSSPIAGAPRESVRD